MSALMMAMFTLISTSFSHNDSIPSRHTCDGTDISPALSWSGIPEGTQSLVLIVDDPDAPDPAAPKMTWVHWILYNIPPTATGLVEGATEKNFHKLYALNTVLPDLQHPTKAKLEQAMRGHIIAKTELIGRYQQKQ